MLISTNIVVDQFVILTLKIARRVISKELITTSVFSFEAYNSHDRRDMSKKGQKVTLLSIPRIKTFKSRPPVVCGKFLLSDSYHKQKDSLIIPESELYETLYEIYPQACFIELFQWILFFEKNSYLIDSKKLALAYNFYWGDHETELKKNFSMWPQEFIHWSISKKAHSGDLRPINLYSQMNPKLQTSFWFLLESFDKAQLSLSEGKKILEWIIDLLSRGESIDTLDFKKKEASLPKVLQISHIKKIGSNTFTNLDILTVLRRTMKKLNLYEAPHGLLEFKSNLLEKGIKVVLNIELLFHL